MGMRHPALDAWAAREENRVSALCEDIGYGRTMQLAEQLWRQKLMPDGMEGGEHTTGPCALFMVPCPHPVLDDNGHCEVCCGCGRITKWVAAHLCSTPTKET